MSTPILKTYSNAVHPMLYLLEHLLTIQFMLNCTQTLQTFTSIGVLTSSFVSRVGFWRPLALKNPQILAQIFQSIWLVSFPLWAFVFSLSLGNVRVGTFGWDLPLGSRLGSIFDLGTLVWDALLGDSRLGSFASAVSFDICSWKLPLGNRCFVFRLESVTLKASLGTVALDL